MVMFGTMLVIGMVVMNFLIWLTAKIYVGKEYIKSIVL